jgi:hypothetical protein
VTQATAANLNAKVIGTGTFVVQDSVLDACIASNIVAVHDTSPASQAVTNAGTFAVQATLAAETTKVIGTVNQGTSPWVTKDTILDGCVTSNVLAVSLPSATVSTLTPVTAAAIASAIVSNPPAVVISGPVQTGNAPVAVSVGVSSASCLVANTSRTSVVFVNTSANVISFGFGANAAVLYSGVTLYPGGTLTMDISDHVEQAILAIASVAASSLAIQEFN